MSRTSAKFLLIFVCSFLAGFGLLITPAGRPLMVKYSAAVVRLSAALISTFGGTAKVDGEQGVVLLHPSNQLGVAMMDGCNGINVTVLLCSAVLAFPASWTARAKGLLIGILAIQSINVVRFISLFYILQYSKPLFDFAHHYLWESLIMLDALVVFWLWAQRVLRTSAIQSAA
ncbi:MAG TPA: exosortase H [Bryobacteraceae bacterium]|jgi:exosortase H (IPTLxxWG-CTERM-specific)|nr:exosortase H [Bryobacteraceae bacterium]